MKRGLEIGGWAPDSSHYSGLNTTRLFSFVSWILFFVPLAVENSGKVKIDFYWEFMNEAGSATPDSANIFRAKPGGLPGKGVRECG